MRLAAAIRGTGPVDSMDAVDLVDKAPVHDVHEVHQFPYSPTSNRSAISRWTAGERVTKRVL